MDMMNSVSNKKNIAHVPAVAKANRLNRSVGFGIMDITDLSRKTILPMVRKY